VSVRLQSRSSRVRRRASSATSPFVRWWNEHEREARDWLEENPKEGGQIVAKSLQAHGPVKRRATRAISRDARARSTAPDSGQARRLFVNEPRECELFIVEGNSAGGSRRTRAIRASSDPADSRQDPERRKGTV